MTRYATEFSALTSLLETDGLEQLCNVPQKTTGVQGCGPWQDEIYGMYNVGNNWNSNAKFGEYLGEPNVRMISKKVTQLLEGVHPEGKTIVVPDESIRETMVGTFKRNSHNFNPVQLINETVSMIVSQIKGEFQTIENNNKLSPWVTVYGNENEWGLRRHAPIKKQEKQRSKFFMWNY